jgi:hypothetical protein
MEIAVLAPTWALGLMKSHPPMRPSLTDGVLLVLSWSPSEQVRGVYAERVVTAMADIKTCGNRAVMQLVRQSMGVDLRASGGCPQIAVRTIVGTEPRPAFGVGAAVYFRPKPRGECARLSTGFQQRVRTGSRTKRTFCNMYYRTLR